MSSIFCRFCDKSRNFKHVHRLQRCMYILIYIYMYCFFLREIWLGDGCKNWILDVWPWIKPQGPGWKPIFRSGGNVAICGGLFRNMFFGGDRSKKPSLAYLSDKRNDIWLLWEKKTGRDWIIDIATSHYPWRIHGTGIFTKPFPLVHVAIFHIMY